MNYIIFDIEATCDIERDFPMETIEIGGVKLNKFGDIIDSFSKLVKPSYSYITSYCTDLTGITGQLVSNAYYFPKVINDFKEFIGDEDHILYSWGDYDRRQLLKDCKYHNIDSSFLERHKNMKEFYTETTGVRAKGLKKAINFMGIDFQGDRHRAYPDALATSKIFKRLLKGDFPTIRK